MGPTLKQRTGGQRDQGNSGQLGAGGLDGRRTGKAEIEQELGERWEEAQGGAREAGGGGE